MLKRLKMRQLQVVFVLCFVAQFVPIKSQANDCITRTKCSECIQRPNCGWCSKKDYLQNSGPRCNLVDKLKDCTGSIENPANKIDKLQDVKVGTDVQVQPQKIKLSLRPGKAVEFPVFVRPAENFPVDLYYLMDMSWSMRDDLDKLKTLGKVIATSMRNITKNFRLGFGSFVDKTVSPYIRTEQSKPCDADQKCIPSYGYRHILKLTNDEKVFDSQVASQIISGNLDEPEGGFDALMQAAVCEKV